MIDYKTLYGIIFMPIFIAILYLGYIHILKEKPHQQIYMKNSQNTDNHFEQLPADLFRKELQQSDVILIDVRTNQEQENYGVISNNQLHIEYGSSDFYDTLLALDKSKKYLIYCWHGVRSAHTRDFMQEQGFHWVKDLKGGIDAWD